MIGIYRDRDNGDGVDWDRNGGSGDNGGGDRDFVYALICFTSSRLGLAAHSPYLS